MLLVDARAGISQIHGIGLIAHEFIPQGTCLWVFRPDFDVVFTEAQLQALPPALQRQMRHYCYYHPGKQGYILCSDDARFTNHSDDPNMGDEGDTNYALRAIEVGEELTWDYRPWGAVDFLEEASPAVNSP
jgi:hypothetical protein